MLPYLQQHNLVTDDEQDNLNNMMYTLGKKSQLLLSYLKSKGHESLQMFLCSLNLAHEHRGHKGIAKKLKEKMQANGIECEDFCSPECDPLINSTS